MNLPRETEGLSGGSGTSARLGGEGAAGGRGRWAGVGLGRGATRHEEDDQRPTERKETGRASTRKEEEGGNQERKREKRESRPFGRAQWVGGGRARMKQTRNTNNKIKERSPGRARLVGMEHDLPTSG